MLSGWSFSFILKFNMADRTMVLSDGLKKRMKQKQIDVHWINETIYLYLVYFNVPRIKETNVSSV